MSQKKPSKEIEDHELQADDVTANNNSSKNQKRKKNKNNKNQEKPATKEAEDFKQKEAETTSSKLEDDMLSSSKSIKKSQNDVLLNQIQEIEQTNAPKEENAQPPSDNDKQKEEA